MLLGKTILSSATVDHLRMKQYEDTVVIYIYCDYRNQIEQTSNSLLSNLLKQLISYLAMIPDDVTKLYNSHRRGGTRPSSQEIMHTLQSVVSQFSRTYVIIDALDELNTREQVHQDLLTHIHTLRSSHHINVMTTARQMPSLTLNNPDFLHVKIRASPEDVRKYVYGHMKDLSSFVQKDQDLQDAIADAIVDAVDGMYVSLVKANSA